MTSTQERVLRAVERWEADQASQGYTRCSSCGDWHHGPTASECEACEAVSPTVTIASLIGLAMMVR